MGQGSLLPPLAASTGVMTQTDDDQSGVPVILDTFPLCVITCPFVTTYSSCSV